MAAEGVIVTRRASMKRAFAAAGIGVLVIWSSAGCPGEQPIDDTPPPAQTLTIELKGTEAATPTAPYDLCARDERPAGSEAGVQIFLDASGSMRGFSVPQVMSPLAQWVKRSAIGAPAANVQFSLIRVQAFSTAGIIDLPARAESVNYPVEHGNTNIDEMIARARDEAITVIATDGVPYTAGAESASCAGQVDVTCVAKRLREFLDDNAHPGMWIVPLFGQYDGKFSAEGQQIPNDPAWADSTARQLKETLGGDIRIRANNGPDRAMNPFFYTGPRTMLLIVLAKDASMGRIFLSALYERAGLYRVALVDEDFTAFTNATDKALAAFTPVELYPGYTPRVTNIHGVRRKRSVADTPEDAGGFIDVKRLHDGTPFRAEVACAAARESTPDEIVDLTFSTASSDVCRKLYSLPSVQYLPELPARTTEADRQDAASVVRSLALSQGSAQQPGSLRGELHIRCAGTGGKPCSSPTTIRVVAKVAYSDAAERLADRRASSGAVAYLQKLSTDSLVTEPFKVLALDRMLIEVMRTITQDASARDAAAIEVCRVDAVPKPAATVTDTSAQ
jgi:hypothetical protein